MKKYLSWNEKKAIVDEAYAYSNNIKPTAAKYNVSPSQIRRWQKKLDENKTNFQDMPEARKKYLFSLKVIQKGRPPKDVDGYSELKKYYNNLRSMNHSVSVKMLCLELKRIQPSLAVSMFSLQKRIYRWLKREQLLEKSSSDYYHDLNPIHDFVSGVNRQIHSLGIPSPYVVNIDEMNMEFEGLRRINPSLSRFTAVFGVTMSGVKLPPFLVFKKSSCSESKKSQSTINNDSNTICLFETQDNGWMDKKVFLQWIKKVWLPFCQKKESSCSCSDRYYLLMDDFAVHCDTEIHQELEINRTEIELIPSSYASHIQPISKGIQLLLKKRLNDINQRFLLNINEEKVDQLDIIRWIEKIWLDISSKSICDIWSSLGYQEYHLHQ